MIKTTYRIPYILDEQCPRCNTKLQLGLLKYCPECGYLTHDLWRE